VDYEEELRILQKQFFTLQSDSQKYYLQITNHYTIAMPDQIEVDGEGVLDARGPKKCCF